MNYVIVDRFHAAFVCKDHSGALYLGDHNNAFIYKSLNEAYTALANDLTKDVCGQFIIMRLKTNGTVEKVDEKYL